MWVLVHLDTVGVMGSIPIAAPNNKKRAKTSEEIVGLCAILKCTHYGIILVMYHLWGVEW